jgi:hypothetical protein
MRRQEGKAVSCWSESAGVVGEVVTRKRSRRFTQRCRGGCHAEAITDTDIGVVGEIVTRNRSRRLTQHAVTQTDATLKPTQSSIIFMIITRTRIRLLWQMCASCACAKLAFMRHAQTCSSLYCGEENAWHSLRTTLSHLKGKVLSFSVYCLYPRWCLPNIRPSIRFGAVFTSLDIRPRTNALKRRRRQVSKYLPTFFI